MPENPEINSNVENELHKLMIKHYGLTSAEQVRMFGIMMSIAEQFVHPALATREKDSTRDPNLLITEAAMRLTAAFMTETRLKLTGPVSVERMAFAEQASAAIDELPAEDAQAVFDFQMDTPSTLALLQMIQIGLQHPLSSGVVATTCRRIGETLAEQLIARMPQLQGIISLGWEGVIR